MCVLVSPPPDTSGYRAIRVVLQWTGAGAAYTNTRYVYVYVYVQMLRAPPPSSIVCYVVRFMCVTVKSNRFIGGGGMV